jgi:hypothetical protein
MSFTTVLLLILTSAGGDYDLLSLLDCEAYFKSRGVAVGVPEMAALAGQEPKDGKAQVQQLLALRWLGEHAEKAKGDAKARAVLEAVAAVKKAQDPQGFAKEYATRALALVHGKAPAPRQVPADSLRSDAFAWFPAGEGGVAVLAGVDLRAAGTMKGPSVERVRAILETFGPQFGNREKNREAYFHVAETLGNLRPDRVSLSVFTERKDSQTRMMLRATGAFDQARIVALLRAVEGVEVKLTKGSAGEPIAFVRYPFIFNASIYFVLVGDTDALLVAEPADKGKPFAELEAALALRAGKGAGVLKGPLGDLLKDVPDRAVVVAVGEFTKEARERLMKEARAETAPLIPRRYAVHAVRDTALRLSGRAEFPAAADARAFVATAEGLVGTARAWLKGPPPDAKIPPATVVLMNKTLDGVEVQARESTVRGMAVISDELIGALLGLVEENIKR